MAPPLRGFVSVDFIAATLLAGPVEAAVKCEDIAPERELLITTTSVVNSPATKFFGPWSYGGLVERLVGKDGERLRAGQAQNLDRTPKTRLRSRGTEACDVEKLINPWQDRDGYEPGPEKKCETKLANARFWPSAIALTSARLRQSIRARQPTLRERLSRTH